MILVQAAEKLVVNRLHGTIGRVNEHQYSFTKKSYNKFELNGLIKRLETMMQVPVSV